MGALFDWSTDENKFREDEKIGDDFTVFTFSRH